MNKLLVIVLIAALVYLILLIVNPNRPAYQSIDMNKLHFSYEDATKVAESLRL